MIKRLLFISFLIGGMQAFSQAVPNGGFENWTNNGWENPDGARTSSPESIRRHGVDNVTKSTDKQSGSYAIKLETIIAADDTTFGYCLFGDFGDNGPQGGFPYSQNPTTITGYYKCNLQPGDTAGILVAFRKGAVSIPMDIFNIVGTHTVTYTAFSFTLSIGTLTVTPDSVVIAAVSSIPRDINPNSTPKNGSWILFDNIAFTGAGITQQVPNTNFEDWTAVNIEEPVGWSTRNLNAYTDGLIQVLKIYVPYSGATALQMTTLSLENGNHFAFDITNGKFIDNGGQDHGRPYTQAANDTLMGYYKYNPSNTDTGSVMVECFNNGNVIGGGYITFSVTGSSYKPFKLPITCAGTPDSMRIDFYSSSYPVDLSKVGSSLIIDNLELKSDPLGIYFYGKGAEIKVYPNPTVSEVNFDFKGVFAKTLEIVDINGKTIEIVKIAGEHITLNTRSYPAGNYFYKLATDKNIVSRGKFIVTK